MNQKQGEAPLGYLQVLMRSPDREKHWPVAAAEGLAHVVSPHGPGRLDHRSAITEPASSSRG